MEKDKKYQLKNLTELQYTYKLRMNFNVMPPNPFYWLLCLPKIYQTFLQLLSEKKLIINNLFQIPKIFHMSIGK